MLFDNVKMIVQNHAKQYDSLKEDFLKQKKEIYSNGDASMSYKDKIFAQAKEKYETDRLNLIQTSRAETGAAFAEIFGQIEAAITADVGADSIAELQALQNTKMSKFELNAYAKKYSGKYKALKLLNAIAENSGIKFEYVTDEDIIGDLTAIQGMVTAFINGYDGMLNSEYIPRLILFNADSANEAREDNKFKLLETEFETFLNPCAVGYV